MLEKVKFEILNMLKKIHVNHKDFGIDQGIFHVSKQDWFLPCLSPFSKKQHDFR